MKARRMTAYEFSRYLNTHLLKSSREEDYPNPWRAYEAAKSLTKQTLCNSPDGFDWQLYDYYQPMIVNWSGVYQREGER